MNIKIWVFGICFLFTLSISLYAEKAIILKQEEAPLKITGYTTKYLSYERERITHSVNYLNVSEQKIVALRFGFVAFDAFNEFLDKFGGFTIEDVIVKKEKKGRWAQSPYGVSTFKKYGTGIIYVDKVRFEDGTIWASNKEDILPQIQEIQEGFTADMLEEKKVK